MKPTFADHFLLACGSEQPLRVTVTKSGETNAERWVFPRPYLVIGRRGDSDLVLDHWQISRRHAYIQYLDGGFFCVDLGSRTGTHGGVASERSGWVPRDQMIRVGPYEVRPTWPPRPPEDSGSNVDDESPGVVWELPPRALGSAVWRMDPRLVLVGRSPACKIRLIEKDVSKFHCSLVRTPLGVWVVDLLGQNGITVNGEPVRCSRLDDGDELKIGQHVLRPRYETPPPRLSATDIVPVLPVGEVPPRPTSSHVPARYERRPGAIAPKRITVPAPAMPPAGVSLSAILEGQSLATDPMMSAMVQQFGLMQQQMFEQFHNTMMAMFDGFAAMHREQSDAMREEIEQVRRLSQEIETLQAEAKQREAAAEAKAKAAPPRPPLPDPVAGLSDWPPRAPSPPPAPPAAPVGPPKKTVPGADDPGSDIHEQLIRRLASIHSERQGRWQKILGMMSNRS